MGARQRSTRRLALSVLGLLAALFQPGGAAADRSFIPIPEIITDPNEGNTLGLLAVVLFLDEKDEIKYMLAPDVRYNETKGLFPTFRFFGYPSPTRRYTILAGKSTTVDEEYELEFSDRGLWDGRAFVRASVEHERDSTERFFGLGNDSREEDESNYTDVDTVARLTPGLWLLPHVNLSYRMRIRRYAVERGQVDDLPFVGSREAPPATRARLFRRTGVYWAHQVALAYDSRDEVDIPRRGSLASVYTEMADERLGSTTSFVKFGLEWRRFVPLRRGNPVLALRALADWTSGARDTPFWEQNKLGGRRALRGFGSQRFVDFNRSLLGAEVRTRVWERRIFGVDAELELAPFLEAGEVFRRISELPVADPHWVWGLGFRGIVRPQIVGFVDIGVGSEGVAVFTGVDYPF